MPTITQRLAADPAAYPPPDGGWTDAGVRVILANPKYTGHQVFGRHRTRDGRRYHPPLMRGCGPLPPSASPSST